MSNELAERTHLSTELQEKALLGGDLSKLTPQERLSYYSNLCASLDLNPLSRPFEYLQLNGKLQLYARKDCTEQLRTSRKVSITILSREVVEGVYIVTARATDATGRQDEAIGAVPIANVQGNDRANAMMKAETKAKRRVTLSICGLGMLDETEIETIKGARVPLEAVTVGLVPNIPDVRPPSGDHDYGKPAEPIHRDNPFDDPYPKPSKQAADGPQSQEAIPPTAEAQPRRDDPPAPSSHAWEETIETRHTSQPKSAAEFARKKADEMSDDPYVDGILGNFQPYQGTKAFQKGAKPGVFDVEDGQGGIIMHGIKYFDPEMDVSSGLKRVYYKTDSYKGRTQYNAVRIDSLDA